MTSGFGEVAERLRRSTVQVVERGRGAGSGLIWNNTGTIVTNAHVVRDRRARVILWDGRTLEGDVSRRDDRLDLAEIRVAANSLPAASRGNSDLLRAGELVVAIGNPMGFIGALTTGVVHAVGALRGLGRRTWVQAAVRLAPGNSGGPLADSEGRVVGLNTMIVRGGLALAIPSNRVAEFLDSSSSTGRPPIRIGVSLQAVELGFLILEVESNSPAEMASLLPGDILTGFETADDLADAIGSARGSLVLEFLRGTGHGRRQVTVRLQAEGAAAA